jgi:hypothetical protein
MAGYALSSKAVAVNPAKSASPAANQKLKGSKIKAIVMEIMISYVLEHLVIMAFSVSRQRTVEQRGYLKVSHCPFKNSGEISPFVCVWFCLKLKLSHAV